MLGLIEEALNEAERLAVEEAGQPDPTEAGVGPCESGKGGDGEAPLEEV